jgi:Ca2+/Na+ antiporter
VVFTRHAFYRCGEQEETMLNQRSINLYGFISVGIMLVMLLLMLAKVVPRSMYGVFLLIAVVLFAVRLILRLLYHRQARNAEKEKEDTSFKEEK